MSHRLPVAKQPDNHKDINVGFILLNHSQMTIEQMADHLNCSTHKIRVTIKEYKIPYQKKDHFFTKFKKKEEIKHF